MDPAGMNGFAIGNCYFESDRFDLVARVARCNCRTRNGTIATSPKYCAWFIGASERKEARWLHPVCLSINDLKLDS